MRFRRLSGAWVRVISTLSVPISWAGRWSGEPWRGRGVGVLSEAWPRPAEALEAINLA